MLYKQYVTFADDLLSHFRELINDADKAERMLDHIGKQLSEIGRLQQQALSSTRASKHDLGIFPTLRYYSATMKLNHELALLQEEVIPKHQHARMRVITVISKLGEMEAATQLLKASYQTVKWSALPPAQQIDRITSNLGELVSIVKDGEERITGPVSSSAEFNNEETILGHNLIGIGHKAE